MKHFVELNQTDIVKLVAKEFQVEETDVVPEYREVCKGYGLNEHYERELFVTVEIPN